MSHHDSPLKKLRLARGFTIGGIAIMLDVTPGSVNRWERGVVIPSFFLLSDLAYLYRVDYNVLIPAILDSQNFELIARKRELEQKRRLRSKDSSFKESIDIDK